MISCDADLEVLSPGRPGLRGCALTATTQDFLRSRARQIAERRRTPFPDT
jgi:hypothetical protein